MLKHEERLLPEKMYREAYSTYSQFLGRYMFAARFLGPRATVVDLGCGCGYGAAYLAESPGRTVIGIDRSLEAATYGRQHYPVASLKFLTASATGIPIETSNVDAVIAMELIEHVEEAALMLSEVNRVLKADGLFICSTPNKLVTGSGEKPTNPYHVREFTPDELRALLRRTFDEFSLYGQVCTHASRLHQENMSRIWHNLSLLRDELHAVGSCLDLDERVSGLSMLKKLVRMLRGGNGRPNVSFRDHLKRLDAEFRQAEYSHAGFGDWDITPYDVEEAPVIVAVCRK